MIKKFRNDLRKLFEVKKKGKGWADDPSSTLPVIFENSTRLKTIYLVCSWMEHNTVRRQAPRGVRRIQGEQHAPVREPDCTMTIWDAKQFAGSWGVDEGLQVLIAHSKLAARIAAKADALRPTSAELDDKFACVGVRS